MSLCILAFLWTILVLHVSASSPFQKLFPYHIEQYEAAKGIQRRNLDRWDLNPQQRVDLMYGRRHDEKVATIANISVEAPDGLPIVLLEKFEPLTRNIDCNGDDGHISLTFQSEDAFKWALDAWGYINQQDDHRFVVIANHHGCGAGDDRQAYIITKIREDPEKLTTHLTSQPVDWYDIFHTFDLSVGNFEHGSPSARGSSVRRKRSLFYPRFECPFKGYFCEDPDHPVRLYDLSDRDAPIRVDLRGPPKLNIFEIPPVLAVSCLLCMVTMSLVLTFRVQVSKLSINAMTLSAQTQNIRISTPISIVTSGNNAWDDVGGDKDIVPSFPIPGFGLSGPWGEIGGLISLKSGYHAEHQEKADVLLTFGGSLPGAATVTVDALAGNNEVDRFDEFNYDEPRYFVRGLENPMSGSYKLQVAADYGFEAKWGGLKASLGLPLPELKIELTPKNQPGGLCKKKNPKKDPNGVIFKAFLQTGIDASLVVGKPDASGGTVDINVWSHPVTDKPQYAFIAQCVALGVEGVATGKKLPGTNPIDLKPGFNPGKIPTAPTPSPAPGKLSDAKTIYIGEDPGPGEEEQIAQNPSSDGDGAPSSPTASPVSVGAVATLPNGNDTPDGSSNLQPSSTSDASNADSTSGGPDPLTPASSSRVSSGNLLPADAQGQRGNTSPNNNNAVDKPGTTAASNTAGGEPVDNTATGSFQGALANTLNSGKTSGGDGSSIVSMGDLFSQAGNTPGEANSNSAQSNYQAFPDTGGPTTSQFTTVLSGADLSSSGSGAGHVAASSGTDNTLTSTGNSNFNSNFESQLFTSAGEDSLGGYNFNDVTSNVGNTALDGSSATHSASSTANTQKFNPPGDPGTIADGTTWDASSFPSG